MYGKEIREDRTEKHGRAALAYINDAETPFSKGGDVIAPLIHNHDTAQQQTHVC